MNNFVRITLAYSVLSETMDDGSYLVLDEKDATLTIVVPNKYKEIFYIMPEYFDDYLGMRARRFEIMGELPKLLQKDIPTKFLDLVNENNRLAIECGKLYRKNSETIEWGEG